jgi:hypothetical protein
VTLDGVLSGTLADADVALMLGIATQMSWLARYDPAVMAGHHRANPASKLAPFDEHSRGTYHRTLGNWLQTLPRPEVKSLAPVDELIRGVVPVPLPAADSWWRTRVAESGQTLVRLFGNVITIPELGSPYKQLLDEGVVAPGYSPLRSQDAPGVAPDTVAWVLRVRSPGDKSRVIYVSDT